MANRADSLIPACFDINSVIIIRFRIRSFQMKLITITSWRCLGRWLGRWWLCCHWFRCRWICCYLCCRFWILCRWFFRCCRLKKLSLDCCFNQLMEADQATFVVASSALTHHRPLQVPTSAIVLVFGFQTDHLSVGEPGQ